MQTLHPSPLTQGEKEEGESEATLKTLSKNGMFYQLHKLNYSKKIVSVICM